MTKLKYPYYHIFRDSCDCYTQEYSEAEKLFNQWKDEGYANIRVYKEYSEGDEDCLLVEGSFPMQVISMKGYKLYKWLLKVVWGEE